MMNRHYTKDKHMSESTSVGEGETVQPDCFYSIALLFTLYEFKLINQSVRGVAFSALCTQRQGDQ